MTTCGIPSESQLKKLQGHNKSAIDLSNANPAYSHKDIPRSTSHIMVTTRYSDQQEFNRKKGYATLRRQWDRPISKWFIKPPYAISRAASIDSDCRRLPTTSELSQQQNGQITHQPALINKSKFIKATYRIKIRKIEIPRSMVEEQALT